MDTQQLVHKLCALAPSLMDECGYWLTQRRCIASTRVGVETLRALGFDAEPLPVLVQACNREFLKYGPLVTKGKMSAEEAKKKGARLLVIDDNPESEIGGYPGHLVVLLKAERLMIDLDIGQFNRPGIETPRAVSMEVSPAFIAGTDDVVFELPHNALMLFRRVKKPYEWRHSPDWAEEKRWRRIVRRLVDKLKESP